MSSTKTRKLPPLVAFKCLSPGRIVGAGWHSAPRLSEGVLSQGQAKGGYGEISMGSHRSESKANDDGEAHQEGLEGLQLCEASPSPDRAVFPGPPRADDAQLS